MGIPLSILGNLGLPGVNSLYMDQFYQKYFGKKEIRDFNQFHSSFIDLCREFNEVMPGKRYTLPPSKDIQDLYNEWKASKNYEEKKNKFTKYLKEHVTEYKTNDQAMIMTGLIVPTTAILLKKNIENVPQAKKFKLHLVPNFAFVPACTLVGLVVARVLHVNKTSKS